MDTASTLAFWNLYKRGDGNLAREKENMLLPPLGKVHTAASWALTVASGWDRDVAEGEDNVLHGCERDKRPTRLSR